MLNRFSKAKTSEEIKGPRVVFLFPHRILIVLRHSLFLLPFLLSFATFAVEPSVQEQWKAFLTKPSASTYEPLSRTIRMCVSTKCHEAGVAGTEDNFANFYKLLELAEYGNHYAMEIAFQIRPLYENAAVPSEDINNSLGLSTTRESRFFLELIRKYDIPVETLETLAVQTSRESIDNIRAQRNELRSRIESLLKVTDPGLLQLRDKTISLIQHWLDKYSTLPDDAGAK